MAVGTVGSGPIYPCAIGAGMVNALAVVRSFDRCAVVTVCAGRDFAVHAVGESEFGV